MPSSLRRKQYLKEHPQYKREAHRLWRLRTRNSILALYGHKCACCNETHREFLTLDHVHNNGAEQRRLPGQSTGAVIARRILIGALPKADYELLCWNCNCAKGTYGYCPHDLENA